MSIELIAPNAMLPASNDVQSLAAEAPKYSDDMIAESFGQAVNGKLKWVDQWGKFLIWKGSTWAFDQKRESWMLVRKWCREMARQWGGKEDGRSFGNKSVIAAVHELMRSNTDIAATVDQWDNDPWLLGTPNGTVDLRTGELRESRLEDYITKSTAVAPAPSGTPTPAFDAFLERIFRHDPELVPFIWRVLGYSLTGLVTEQSLFFAWGQGGNGKGVLLNTVTRIMADYAAVAPSDLLLVTHSDRHPCDLAMLRGARFVTAQELAPGRAWDEPKMKSLTGGDRITARFMRADFFTYEPQFKLFVAGNHQPSFTDVDEATRRRVKLIPFLQNIPREEQDGKLADRLREEWPGILRRMIEGCLEWQRMGLAVPQSVRDATEDYLNSEDGIGQWIEDSCERVTHDANGNEVWTSLSALYSSWSMYCVNRSAGTDKALSKRLNERGFKRDRNSAGTIFFGIRVRPWTDAREPLQASDASARQLRNVAPAHGLQVGATVFKPT